MQPPGYPAEWRIDPGAAAGAHQAGLVGNNPPTFHEIRSLGGALLRDAGWTLDLVQALMGHSESTMTEH